MNKTKIEYCDFTVNPITGKCLHSCNYCYAEKIRKRFKWPEAVQFLPELLNQIERRKKPAVIFIGSMHDVFGGWVSSQWIVKILRTVANCQNHTFLFSTKNPGRYLEFNFPRNCWLGATADTGKQAQKAVSSFYKLNHPYKWLSVEPLTEDVSGYVEHAKIRWLVIGGMTPKPVHKTEWAERLLKVGSDRNIPIFLKQNLRWPGVQKQERPF